MLMPEMKDEGQALEDYTWHRFGGRQKTLLPRGRYDIELAGGKRQKTRFLVLPRGIDLAGG